MNETPASTGTEDLRETCATLRYQLNSALILLLIVSSTITVFFLRQSTLARKDRDYLSQTVADYQENAVPALNEFAAKLREYAKTHPDVVPILAKYGVVQVTNTAAAPR
jgi:negative regulator of genetic competence, sporulation and motility